MTDAQRSTHEARQANSPAQRFVYAHLAALRAAAAVVARRRHSNTVRLVRARRSPTVWQVMAALAPEYREWADYFAAGASKRAACESGVKAATEREANDLLRAAEDFVHLVAATGTDAADPLPRPPTDRLVSPM